MISTKRLKGVEAEMSMGEWFWFIFLLVHSLRRGTETTYTYEAKTQGTKAKTCIAVYYHVKV